MANYDIPVSVDLQEALNLPQCIDLALPNPGPLKVQLPTGGSLSAFSDISKGIPTDCQLTLSLLLQLAPLLASMECLLKILGVLGPLLEVVTSLTKPSIPGPGLIKELADKVAALQPCIALAIPGAGFIPFVRDLLCLILKVLRCFLGQLKTIAGVMGGLAIKIQLAQQNNDTDQLAILQCAKDNAVASAGQVSQAMGPLTDLLAVAGTVMSLAQVEPIKLPTLGDTSDVEALNQAVASLESVVNTISQVVEALPPGGPC